MRSSAGSKPSVYNPTATKSSNTEHALFAGESRADNGSVIFGIGNARHLHNIRFKEKDLLSAPTMVEYQIKNDISWEYALNSGTVYDHAAIQWPPGGNVGEYYFRPLALLRKNSTLMSESEDRIRSLKRFRMDINHMGLRNDETSAIGLVAENNGTIKNLILEDIYVNGVREDHVERSAKATGRLCREKQRDSQWPYCKRKFGKSRKLRV